MDFLRPVAMAAAFSAIFGITAAAQTVTPAAPSVTTTFEIDGDIGKVVGMVTAPKTSNTWQALPDDTKMDITVTRSCYALGESNLAVASFVGLAPGESADFTDGAEPAWQYGQQYTYTATASIGSATNQGSATMTPGISFTFAYNTVTVAPVETDGGFEAVITAIVPSKTTYPVEDIPVEMTALEFYRVTDSSAWPYVTELMGTIENPVKGHTYLFTDKTPTLNADNYYVVRCVSPFGFAETSTYTYVGYDTPREPYPVKAEAIDGGNRITWTAPDEGMNWGMIDPDDTYYIVYRCWGRGSDQREQIATDLKETEYVDYGTDMEFPRAVRYEVQSANSVGLGGSEYSSNAYDLVVGPAERLPFVETFDGGADHIWTFGYSSYYCQFYEATEAEYNGGTLVSPHSGSGLVYVDYAYSRGDATNDLKSYKINVSGSSCLALSFWYYAIPDNDITISADVAKDGGGFETLRTIGIADDVTQAEWRRVFIPLADMDDAGFVELRFHISAPTSKMAAILDDIMLINYPSVGEIAVEYDSEECSAVLSWADPSTEYADVVRYEGFIDGESVGDVESPWTFHAADYQTPYSIAIKAVYDEIEAPLSSPVRISVPRPAFTEFTIDNHVFSIVTSTLDSKEVIIKQYLGNDMIYKAPEMVSYDDVSYDVIGIGAEAYMGNASLISVSLHDNIAEIGERAFMDCTSLMSVGFGKGLQVIENAAFKGCSSLASVIFTAASVPAVGNDAFEGIKDGCQGQCPDGMTEEYAAVEGLAPITFPTLGISAVAAGTAAEVLFFDMQGRPVANPSPGQPVIVRTTSSDGIVTTVKVVRF